MQFRPHHSCPAVSRLALHVVHQFDVCPLEQSTLVLPTGHVTLAHCTHVICGSSSRFGDAVVEAKNPTVQLVAQAKFTSSAAEHPPSKGFAPHSVSAKCGVALARVPGNAGHATHPPPCSGYTSAFVR
jgi:hypothetical protein